MSLEQKILQNIIDNAIPSDVLPPSPLGEVSPEDLLRTREELEEQIKKVAEIPLPRVTKPPSVGGLIKKLIPTIPTKIVPSLADLQDALDKKFDNLKQSAQQSITKTQFARAEEAKRAFSRQKNK